MLIAGAMLLTGCSADVVVEQQTPMSALGHDILLPSSINVLAARVAPGATLSSLLRAHDVAEQEIADLVERTKAVFDVRALRTDRPYRIIRALTGTLRRFEYEIDNDRLLTIGRESEDQEFVAAIDPIEQRTETIIVQGTIDHATPSLFGAMADAGEGVDLSLALAELFSSEVDFNTELQPGDHFRLLVEKRYRVEDPTRPAVDPAASATGKQDEEDDGFSGYGAILGAELLNNGRALRAVRFTVASGKAEYFDDRGRSLKRFFLKSPLKFDPVVTSRFSRNRLHPVLGENRAHLGVDYRAPTGAPVVAVADGLVLSAGMSGGAGRMVHLRHANGFETQYLHLSAATVRAGLRVRQGDIIGRVGSTGLATGPHLDYRVRTNGVFVNPVAVHQAMPPGEPVSATEQPAFEAMRDQVFERLGLASRPSNPVTSTH